MRRVSKVENVIERIEKEIRNMKLRDQLVDNVTDLTLRDTKMLYDHVDYGEDAKLTKKRKLDIDWSDHAEYRSELRDVDHSDLNEMITDKLRTKFLKNPQDRGKNKFKGPEGVAVVDYDLGRNPAKVDVVTTWASKKTASRDDEKMILELSKFVQKPFKAKLSIDSRKIGQRIWEHSIKAGINTLYKYTVKRDEEVALVSYFGDFGEQIFKSGVKPTLNELKKIIKADLINGKDTNLYDILSKKGLSRSISEKLETLLKSIPNMVENLLKGVEFSDISISGDINSGYFIIMRAGMDEIFYLLVNSSRNIYNISFLEKRIISESDPKSFLKELRKLERYMKQHLKSIDKAEAAYMIGKLTVDDIIRSVGKVRSTFEVVDEWVMTEVNVSVGLRTSKRVPDRLIEKWCEKNWHLVTKKAPSRIPNTPSGGGYDGPSGGVDFIPANRTNFAFYDNFGFEQSGRKGEIIVLFSDR